VASSKSKHHEPVDALDEIESVGEQIVEWASRNGKTILSVAGVCLVIAAVYGYYETSRNRWESDASEALASARDDYLAAMGAQPGAITVPELANPAAGAAIRQEYAERFRAVAEEHAGTAGAALAELERGGGRVGVGGGLPALGVLERLGHALVQDARQR